MLVAHARQHRRTQPLARRAVRHVAGRAAEIFGKARHILQPRTNLLTVEVYRHAAHAYHIKLLFHVDTSSDNIIHVQPAALLV